MNSIFSDDEDVYFPPSQKDTTTIDNNEYRCISPSFYPKKKE